MLDVIASECGDEKIRMVIALQLLALFRVCRFTMGLTSR